MRIHNESLLKLFCIDFNALACSIPFTGEPTCHFFKVTTEDTKVIKNMIKFIEYGKFYRMTALCMFHRKVILLWLASNKKKKTFHK